MIMLSNNRHRCPLPITLLLLCIAWHRLWHIGTENIYTCPTLLFIVTWTNRQTLVPFECDGKLPSFERIQCENGMWRNVVASDKVFLQSKRCIGRGFLILTSIQSFVHNHNLQYAFRPLCLILYRTASHSLRWICRRVLSTTVIWSIPNADKQFT